MRYFIVYAHPEPRSLNGSLKDAAVRALEAAGHEVRVADLYAMRFKAVADADDFPVRDAGARLVYHRESEQAYQAGQLRPDVAGEIANLKWAEVVVFQFPMWWFGPPAILKGWFDRVLVNGGIFHYTGMKALAPFVAFRTVRTTPQAFEAMRTRHVERLLAAGQEEPIRYRFENGGDYDPSGVLQDGLGAGLSGLRLHLETA